MPPEPGDNGICSFYQVLFALAMGCCSSSRSCSRAQERVLFDCYDIARASPLSVVDHPVFKSWG